MFAFYPFFHMQISRQKFTITPFLLQYLISRDEMRSANLALISGRQMHRINACIFLVAITKTQNQSIFLFGSALRLSVWLIYNLSFKLFYIYKILSLAFRTKQWLMIQHVSSRTFVLVFPPHTGKEIHWFFTEYSMNPPFYYKLPGDETNVICLDTLVLVTGIDIYFVAISFSSVRNFINSSFTNVSVQLLNNSVRHPAASVKIVIYTVSAKEWVVCRIYDCLHITEQITIAHGVQIILGTKQPQRRQNDCLAAAGIISFTLFLFMTIEKRAILFHKRPPCCR